MKKLLLLVAIFTVSLILGGCGDSQKADLENFKKVFDVHAPKIAELDKQWDAAEEIEDNIKAIESLKAEHEAFKTAIQGVKADDKKIQEIQAKLVAGHEAMIAALNKYITFYKTNSTEGLEDVVDTYHKAIESLGNAETDIELLAEEKKVPWVKISEE